MLFAPPQPAQSPIRLKDRTPWADGPNRPQGFSLQPVHSSARHFGIGWGAPVVACRPGQRGPPPDRSRTPPLAASPPPTMPGNGHGHRRGRGHRERAADPQGVSRMPLWSPASTSQQEATGSRRPAPATSWAPVRAKTGGSPVPFAVRTETAAETGPNHVQLAGSGSRMGGRGGGVHVLHMACGCADAATGPTPDR